MTLKSITLAALFVLVGATGAKADPGQPWQPVFRFYAPGHHFQTLDYNEGINAGMRYEGVSFNVLPQSLPGTVPLFRCYSPGSGDHFVSPYSNCEGFNYEGLYGYVFSQPNWWANASLYRCYANGDHLTTANPNECVSAGLRVESVQGYSPL